MHPGELNKNRNWSAYHLGLQKLLLTNQRVYFLAVISTFKASSCTAVPAIQRKWQNECQLSVQPSSLKLRNKNNRKMHWRFFNLARRAIYILYFQNTNSRSMNLASGVIQVQTSSDEDKLYIKIVALNRIYNFVVEFFFELKLFRVQNTVVSLHILNFKI